LSRLGQHWFTALVVAALAAVVAMGLTYRSATLSLHELTLSPLDNNTWAAAQLQLEYERMSAAIRLARLGEPGMDRDRLQLRIDILNSRLGVLGAGDVARALSRHAAYAEVMTDLQRLLATIDDHMAAGRDQPLTEVAARIHGLLGSADDLIRRFTGDAVQSSAATRERHERELSTLLARLQIVFIIFACGILGGAFALVRQTRAVSRSERQARQMLHELSQANKAKSHFLANMSHELRTPLNAVIGFSEIMRQQILGPLPPRYAGYARDINDSANHLLALIEDVLDMARIEAGHTDIKVRRFALTEALDAAMLVIQPQGVRNDVAIDVAPGPPLLIDGDLRAVRQILINLLGNAVKFTPPRGRVRLDWSLTPAGDLRIAVADDGIGIPPADMGRITQPFHRGSNATAAAVGGTGLGLAITKTLTELHGGTLEIASTLGAGTTVEVVLPAARVHLPPPVEAPLRVSA
jgi:signal transduction histidine kinase